MYSNLYKSAQVSCDEETRVIDNNALLEEKLSVYSRSLRPVSSEDAEEGEEGFQGGLDADNVDALFDADLSGTVIKASSAELEQLNARIEEKRRELEEVSAQVEKLMQDAKEEIAALKKETYEEAKVQGYHEGETLGRQEAEAACLEYQHKQKELEEEYEKKLEELEPEFVDTLTGIYEHIFKVELFRYHDLVTNLLLNAIQRAEGVKNYLLHVSREDYESVMANRERIRSEAGGSASVELVEDMTLSKSQCYIETENGIYDCSLDTQLDELTRKLKLLSYQKD